MREMLPKLISYAHRDLFGHLLKDPFRHLFKRPSWMLCLWSLNPLCIEAQPPTLTIPAGVSATFGDLARVPVVFEENGSAISVVLFSVDFDEMCLELDPTDANEDGVIDSIIFNLPPQFVGSVSFNPTDTDGELDFSIIDLIPPLTALPDGELVTMEVSAICQPADVALIAPLGFSVDPAVSFGDTSGQTVPGISVDGWVEINDAIFQDGFESGDLSAWSTNTGS